MTYQQYPPAGGYPPRFQARPMSPPHRPTAATAITAGVLAALGVGWHGIGAIDGLIGVGQGGLSWVGNLGLLFDLVLVVLLSLGAGLLFARRTAGRVWLIVGCVVAISMYVLAFILVLTGIPDLVARGTLAGALVLLPALPAVATLVLVLLPATSRWLNQFVPRRPQQQYWYQPAPQQGVRPPGW